MYKLTLTEPEIAFGSILDCLNWYSKVDGIFSTAVLIWTLDLNNAGISWNTGDL